MENSKKQTAVDFLAGKLSRFHKDFLLAFKEEIDQATDY